MTAKGLTRSDVPHLFWLLIAIAGISSLHYATNTSRVVLHEVYSYLYYLPIILAAYWYGVWGGLGTAAAVSAAFIPHIRLAWSHNPAHAASQYAQIIAFHVLGLTVGGLAAWQRKLTARHRDAAAALANANRELRDSQQQLRRADRLSALGEIAAGLAHEIQNPLAGVKGALEIIASRVTPGTPEGEFAEIGKKEITRLEGLVREFLSYARPHAPALRPTDLHQIVAHVTTLLRPEADRKGVAFAWEQSGALPLVAVDAEQITQVVFNVVLNAIQATPPGSCVQVRDSSDRDWVMIDVVDEGPGVAPEHVSRIFDPFFTTKSRGTGLGLAMSQRIVAAHYGTIDALQSSTSGAFFRIRLPLRDRSSGLT